MPHVKPMKHITTQALQCMQRACLTGLVLILGWWGGIANAQGVPAAPLIQLNSRIDALEADSAMQVWLDSKGSATIADVTKGQMARFVTASPKAFHALQSGNALWIHLRLQTQATAATLWMLNIPLPYLDMATLYQPDGKGGWTVQSAGDSVAVQQWPRPGLHPQFALNLSPGGVQEVYLQIRNRLPVNVPIRLATLGAHQHQTEIEHLGIGLILGSLLMLTAWCAIQFAAHRSPVDGWYMLYSLLIALAIANATGLAAQFLWPDVPLWADLAHDVMPLLAVGTTLLFLRHVCALSFRYPRFHWACGVLAWLAMAVAPLHLVLDRSIAHLAFNLILASAPLIGLSSIILAWGRANPTAPWLMLAFLPQGIVAAGLLLESTGILPSTWGIRYVLVGAVALAVPLLLHALNIRSRERKEVEVRAEQSPTQDALTGLLAPAEFAQQLREVSVRALEDKEPAAVVLVHIVNFDRIRQVYGDSIAEKCLLRAVVKLHRILRDVDPAGRVGPAQFGLIIEGITSRQDLSERMVKLIASGLIPLPGLKPEVTLQFHVAAVLLNERIPDPSTVLIELGQLLAGQSPRSRRPIRFLEPESTAPAPLDTSSVYGNAGIESIMV